MRLILLSLLFAGCANSPFYVNHAVLNLSAEQDRATQTDSEFLGVDLTFAPNPSYKLPKGYRK